VTVNSSTGVNTVSCTFPSIPAGSSANSVNMTVTGTLSPTATAGKTLTNTATVSEDEVNANSPMAVATTTVSTSGGGGGGTPACGCSKTGAYVKPNPGSAPATTSTKYTVSTIPSSPAGNPFTLTIKSSAGTTVLNQSFAAGTTWGFSPDGTTLVVNVPNQGVYVYNLTSNPPGQSIGPTPLIGNPTGVPYRIQFSPSGQYLAYTTAATPSAGQSGSATLIIYNVRTGKMVYENSGISFYYPASGISGIQDASGKSISVDAFGTLGDWGFSPDNPETSFVYAYLTQQNSFQWNLVRLEQNPTSSTNSTTIASPTFSNLVSAFWQFSPCGDAIAIVSQPSSFAEIQLIRTIDGKSVYDNSGVPVGKITLASDPSPLYPTEQVATDVTSSGTQTYTVNDSTYDLSCSAQNAPAGATNLTIQPTATGTVPTGTLSAPVTLNLPSVGSPGGQIGLSVSTTGSLPPLGFGLGTGTPPNPNYSEYFDLTVSPSSLSYGAPITICINYTGQTFSGQPALWHIVNGTPTNITTTVDAINHIICGSSPSLSPFVIFAATSPVSTTTGLSSSPNPSVAGQAVTLSSQVSPSITGIPTGTVTFSDGGTTIGTATLDATGNATFTTSLLAAGPHSITVAYGGDTYFAGSTSSTLALTVNPAPLTLTANSNSRQYGSVDPTFTVSYSGFVNGDGPASLSGTLTCTASDTASSSVGTYAINCSGLSSPNYAITYMPGTLTITPARLMVAANNASRPYGANNPVFTGTVAGLLNSDPISASFGSSAAPASPVGTYAIVPTLVGAPGVLSNYTIALVNGTLSILPETTSLTIAFSPLSIPVGRSTTVTVTLTAPDMVTPINPSVLAPITVSSPIVSDILTNNGTCTPVPTSVPGIAGCTITLTAVEPNGRTLNASFSGTTALAASTGTADLVVTAPLESKMSCLNSEFRNVSVPGGSYLWFNSLFKVREVPKQKVTISFFRSSVQFQYTAATGNLVKINQPVPDAKIVIDPSVTSASTAFDAVDNVWITTIPFDLDDATFLTGIPWLVLSGGIPADIEPVTWCGTFASDTAGADIGWRWAAAAYSSFSGDNTTLGVKPMNTDHDNPPTNRDNAGTPENFKTFVIPGARGKGGKNYTGSYSGSGTIE
jgi:hypothetical protein